MKKIQKYALALSCGFIAYTSLLSNASALNAYMKVCMSWDTDFDDDGLGEDVDTTVFSDAYGYYKVSLASNDSTISSGYLDTDGCSGYIQLTDGVQYKIRQSTTAMRNDAKVFWFTDSSLPVEWEDACVSYVSYFTPSGHTSGQQYTYYPSSIGPSFNSNIGAVVQRYMRYTSTLNIPTGTHLHITGFSDPPDNSGSDYEGEADNGNGAGTDQYVHIHWSSGYGHSNEKFRVAHELGHAIGAMTTRNFRGGSYLNRDTTHSTYANYCYAGEDTGVSSHWYNSKEFIRAAESEGWAHFIATQFFNYRDDGASAIFGVYRTIPYPSPYPTGISNPTWNSTTAHWGSNLNLATPRRWMEQICNVTSSANMGVEWDWAAFFWHAFANTDDNLDIVDFKSIWPDNGSPDSEYNWTNSSGASITTSATGYLSDDQEGHFFDAAGDCGVDHGQGG